MRHWPIKLSLFLNYFVFAILLNSVGTVILQVQNSYGIGEGSAAVLEAFKDLSIAATSFLVASFVVRIGYKRTMLGALGFIAIVALAMPQLPAFWMAKLMFAATGVGFALVKVSAFATLGLVTDGEKQHASLMNFLEAFFMVGVMSGYFLFSYFVDDLDPGSTGWLDVYYVLAALSIAAFVLLLFARLDESAAQADEPIPLLKEFVDMIVLCIRPLVLIFVVSAFLYVLIEQSIMSWLPTFNSRILHLSTSLSIQMASILAASIALGRATAGVFLRRFAWYPVLTISLLLAATLVLVALPIAKTVDTVQVTRWVDAPLAAFVFPMIGFSLAPIYPAINSVILSALPKHQHAAMAGLIVVFSALGGTSGSIITGQLFEHFGGQAAFYFSLLPIAAILTSLYFFNRKSRENPPPEAQAAGDLRGPDAIYGELFERVQSRRLFADSKTFVDATPKSGPDTILAAYAAAKPDDDASLRHFVDEYFDVPAAAAATDAPPGNEPVRARIDTLWDVLSRASDRATNSASLIALPRPYVVPGGRFREVYYWDSYFTMLGLAEAGRYDAIEDMVENFAFLIDNIGFVPNGNRTYFCTRSQPPVFSLMVELLAEVRDDPGVLQRFLPQLEKEYAFWMAGADTLAADGDAHRRVVRQGGGLLNRHWDDSDRPRPESYAEDTAHAAQLQRPAGEFYRDLRAACESGWDFSSRWLAQPDALASICTTAILPVDLNALMLHLEYLLANAATKNRRLYASRAESRKALLQSLFFDGDVGLFFDLGLDGIRRTHCRSLATAFPLFVNGATPYQAERVNDAIQRHLLADGGWLTTDIDSGQQWDRPNGWAPLQWITYRGLSNYGFDSEAETGATRWVNNNIDVFERTGRLLEKYDVENVGTLATGGEYHVQDGFGWTNGVLLALLNGLGR